MKDPIYRRRQTRWKCPYCGTEGWKTGLEKVSPLFDHDRVDGRKCQKAETKGMRR